ncbi:MAG: hypothetical protein WAN22_20595 [Solirubrobacteraceae bacterium]
MAASRAFELDPAVIEEIAERLSGAIVARVVEVLREEGLSPRPSEATAWLHAQEVAQRLGVSREWVYEHADELGALRIGSGPRPRSVSRRTYSIPGTAPRSLPKQAANRGTDVRSPVG